MWWERQHRERSEWLPKFSKEKAINSYWIWKHNSSKIPNIFKIVQDVYVVPATQTSSEREFSRAKMIKSLRRYRLSDDTFNKLTVVSTFSSYHPESERRRKRKRKTRDINDVELEENDGTSFNNEDDIFFQNNTLEDHDSDNDESESQNQDEEYRVYGRHHGKTMIVLKPCEATETFILAYFENINDVKDTDDFFRYHNKYLGKSSNLIHNIRPIDENNLNYGYAFEMNERGMLKFRNSRKTFINEVGKYIQIV